MAQALTASTWAACFPPGSARHRRATTRLRQPKRPAAAEAERSRRRAAPARRDKGLLDGGNQLQGIALDPEQAVDARHVAVLIELVVAGSALVVDVLALGDQLARLLPLARQDDLARPRGPLAQRLGALRR